MNDGRRHRSAKQGRRNARRTAKRQRGADDSALERAVRRASAKHSLSLLSVASSIIGLSSPDPSARLNHEPQQNLSLTECVTILCNRRSRESILLLAAIAELLVDDHVLRDRCQQEVATRNEHLPKWLADPSLIEAYRVARYRHVLGDGEEWAVGVRVSGGSEFTISAYIDHNTLSAITNVAVHMTPIDEMIADPRLRIDPAAVSVAGDLAEAGAWMANGLKLADFLPQDASWREGRPLVAWLIPHLPGGGSMTKPAEPDEQTLSELLDAFFASPSGAPFRDDAYRDLLTEFIDTGSGDPQRWSSTRLWHALRRPTYDEHVPLEVAVDAPALLRSFVPFAHSRSGIRQLLTDDAIATIGEMSLEYRRCILDDATRYADDEDFEPPL